MLELTSDRWRELSHAYGSAEDIPRLLEALSTVEGESDRAQLWFGVWATLCGDSAVTAAYAAVPHLLEIANARGAAEQVASLHAAAAIEMNRHLAGAATIPGDLVESYAAAVESLPLRVAALNGEPWDEASARILAAALLCGKRQPALARMLLETDERE